MDKRKNFIKSEEDFTCENCGHRVSGSGYTNHCPKCLYSKHVDDIPGDRANPCGGLMAPTGIENEHGEYVLVHKCLRCRVTKRNKADPADNFEEMIRVSQQFRV